MADGFENIINLDSIRQIINAMLPMPSDLEDENDNRDDTRTPPAITNDMLPGILQEAVSACTENSEAVPVAVAINLLSYFTALIGPMVHLPIGDEDRLLNEFVLMVGPSGLGKGASSHGPKRIFRRIEDFLALNLDQQFQSGKSKGIKVYPNLKIHTGGLSSGEGLAAALDDGDDNGIPHSVTDKRLLIFEPEFANSMSMTQRSGNILMTVLRNSYDGVSIEPLTKKNKVKVSNPYVCLLAHVTSKELSQHDQFTMLANNGMLNRFMILWQQPVKDVPFPLPVSQNKVDAIAQSLAEPVLFARDNSHETHWKKIRGQSKPLVMSKDAIALWEKEYGRLLNRPDCEIVKTLTRRHRLHALILASLFSLLDRRFEIRAHDIQAALAWCEYSRKSVVYIFNTAKEQRDTQNVHTLSRKVLLGIYNLDNANKQCTKTDIHNLFQRKLKSIQLQTCLEHLLNYIPPLIEQYHIKSKNNRTVPSYRLTKAAWQQLNNTLSGGS